MKRTKGFTVVELMISLAILGVLVAIVVPGFRDLAERNAVTNASNELLNGLLFARSEAIRTEIDTTFTPLANGWQVTSGVDTIKDQNATHTSITITGNPVTYNARGRTVPANAETLTIKYGDVKSYICISLTGRPYTKSADNGVCP
ncbi:MAG: GspH/FimT family pseudopilin [Candidatus Thiodiazotropha sp.]|jgi:prepilin-type N-terminal cleavage/methylation domain-containing protein